MHLDFGWLLDPVYSGWLLQGLKNTLLLSGTGFLFMVIFGVLGAMCLHFRVPVLESVMTVLVELARNTPSLVQLFFLYFMLSEMGLHFTDAATGRKIPIFSGFVCGVLMLGFYNGAIAVDVIRSGLLAVPKQTVEGAKALGYSSWQIFRWVELPIGLRLTTPLMTNNIVALIKTSSQAALVAVPDLMYAATQVIMENFKSAEVMIVIWILYVLIVSLVVFVIGRLAALTQMPGYNK